MSREAPSGLILASGKAPDAHNCRW